MVSRQTATEKLAKEIVAGRHDDQFGMLVDAVNLRIKSGKVDVRWRIDLPDLSFSEDDLTLDEAFVIEKALEVSWRDIDPMAEARQMRTILATVYEHRHPGGDVDGWLGALTTSQVLAAVSTYTVTDETEGSGPLAAAGSPTS